MVRYRQGLIWTHERALEKLEEHYCPGSSGSAELNAGAFEK